MAARWKILRNKEHVPSSAEQEAEELGKTLGPGGLVVESALFLDVPKVGAFSVPLPD
jgi:hypothetical protein